MYSPDAVLLFALLVGLAFVALAATSKEAADRRFFTRCLVGHLGGLLVVLTVGQALAALAALIAG